MIWPFSKKQDSDNQLPAFKGIYFTDADGIDWRYKPTKHITAHEVARLLPLFGASYTNNVDRIAYIKAEKLERHFVTDTEEE